MNSRSNWWGHLKAWPAVSQSAALKAEHAFKQLPRPAKAPISRLLRGEAVCRVSKPE